ncbi:hypothetical protein [Halomarina pelagica]|nr:hypothetical protein [Halomarina sp. BND7]
MTERPIGRIDTRNRSGGAPLAFGPLERLSRERDHGATGGGR